MTRSLFFSKWTLIVVGGFCTILVIGCSNTKPPGISDYFFMGETNAFIGIGGEILINRVLSGDDPNTPGYDPDGVLADSDSTGPLPAYVIERIDVGDQLIGIGMTQSIACRSCRPGSDSLRNTESPYDKGAMRAFVVTGKERLQDGYQFSFAPLSPTEYSQLVEEVSGGSVIIPPASIPRGTMVISFEGSLSNFTLRTVEGSPGTNWTETTDGERHWNVGIASPSDFWMSRFASDDLGLLPLLPGTASVGMIRFGLSLLPGGIGDETRLEPVSCDGPEGRVMVDFCLSGRPVGTKGQRTPFPIGLETEVVFHPLKTN